MKLGLQLCQVAKLLHHPLDLWILAKALPISGQIQGLWMAPVVSILVRISPLIIFNPIAGDLMSGV
jgi:hypothetical protein